MDDKVVLNVKDIKDRCVAIVRFGPSGFETDGFRPGEYFQVTIDPNRASPDGEFIRFGSYQGDEIVGWQRCAAISVISVLALWPDDADVPALAYGSVGHVTILAE